MVRTGFEVIDAVLFELGFEPGGSPPGGVLPTVVSEHLPGRIELTHGNAENFQHIFRSLAAKQIGSHQEARIIVHESDQVGVTASQSEREDIRLPHLIGSGSFEEPWTNQIAPWFGRALNEALLFERLPDCFRTGLKEEHPFEYLGYSFDAASRFLFFQLQDFVDDRCWQLSTGSIRMPVFKTFLSLRAITSQPLVQAGCADTQFLGHHLLVESFFEIQLHGPKPHLERAARNFFAAFPPRGDVPSLLLYCFILTHVDTSLSLKCQPLSCLTSSHELVVSTIFRD